MKYKSDFINTLFYPKKNQDYFWIGNIYLITIFLLGVYLWGKFLSWNTITLDFYDWAYINVPRLLFEQNALKSGMLPLHMADTQALHNLTDRFLTLPDVITTPQISLLRFVSIPTFVLVDVLINYTIGFAGLLWFRRRFELSLYSFSILFFMFMFNGYIIAHYSVGHLTWDSYFLLPFVFMFIFRFLDGEQGFRWIAGFALTLFYMILAGGEHFFSWILLFLIVMGLFCIRRSKWLIGVGLFSGFLSAVRLLPPLLELKSF